MNYFYWGTAGILDEGECVVVVEGSVMTFAIGIGIVGDASYSHLRRQK